MNKQEIAKKLREIANDPGEYILCIALENIAEAVEALDKPDDEIQVGDYAKVTEENRVFKVCGFTDGSSKVIPAGWLIDEDGFQVNPRYCERYNGAKSVLTKAI